MATRMKHPLKSWVVVYIGFTVALVAANADSIEPQKSLVVTPPVDSTSMTIERNYFQLRTQLGYRNDI